MIKYLIKYRLANDDGIESNEILFPGDPDPINSRREAFQHYESFLEILGDNMHDPNLNLSEHIFKYSKKTKIGNFDIEIPTNMEGFHVNLYFKLTEDFKNLKKNTAYLIIGEQEERSYLTLAENLESEMSYYTAMGYNTQGWTSKIKYWDYESDKEEDIKSPQVLYTPKDFWEEWNPDQAE